MIILANLSSSFYTLYSPRLKALSHCVTIPVSKVLFVIFGISLLSTLMTNHVIQRPLTTAPYFVFLFGLCFISLRWVLLQLRLRHDLVRLLMLDGGC